MMVGTNLKDTQLQQIVDKTILYADKDGDGKISFEEFKAVSAMVSCACHTRNNVVFVFRNESMSFAYIYIHVA